MNNRIGFGLIGLLIFAGGILSRGAAPVIGSAQEHQQVVDKLSWHNEPIKILKINTKRHNIELGKQFSAGEDWLDGLTITFENLFNKAITRVEIDLRFPSPEQTSVESEEKPGFFYTMVYGQDPADASIDKPLKLVLPREAMDVVLQDSNLSSIKSDLQKFDYQRKIRRAQIIVNVVTFADGSQWDGGEMFYPDPNNPKRKFNPKYPYNKQQPAISKPPAAQRNFLSDFSFQFLKSSVPNAPRMFNRSRRPVENAMASQETLPCNTYYVRTDSVPCGPSGEGCTYRKPIYDGSVLPTLHNARKTLDQTRCKYANGDHCAPNPILIEVRLPCGVQFTSWQECEAAGHYWNSTTSTCQTGPEDAGDPEWVCDPVCQGEMGRRLSKPEPRRLANHTRLMPNVDP